jgi:osmotically-inducible protein OsmY
MEPLGNHAIHIVVKNGHVILAGEVDNESDRTVANIKASGVFGVFSVENDLVVSGRDVPKG